MLGSNITTILLKAGIVIGGFLYTGSDKIIDVRKEEQHASKVAHLKKTHTSEMALLKKNHESEVMKLTKNYDNRIDDLQIQSQDALDSIGEVLSELRKKQPCDSAAYYNKGYQDGILQASNEREVLKPVVSNFHYRDKNIEITLVGDTVNYQIILIPDTLKKKAKVNRNFAVITRDPK